MPRLLPVLPLVALGFHQPPPSADGSSFQWRAMGRQPLYATTDPHVFHGRGSLGYLSAVAGYTTTIEQDHRAVKRVTRPMLGFKAFDAAQSTLTGIELMHMLRKGQLEGGREAGRSTAEQFYALAA